MPIQLSGSGSITGVSTLTSLASLDVTGSVSVGGTLIYDDVTNIDSLGIVTARSDVHVGSALSVTGISTFSSDVYLSNDIYLTDGSSGYERVEVDSNDIRVTAKHIHSQFGVWTRSTSVNNRRNGIDGDNNDLLLYSNSTEKVRIKSDGNVGVGDDDPSVPFNVKAGGASFAGQTTHVKIEDTTSLAANVGGLLAFEGVYNTNGDPACYAMIHGGKTNADNGNYAGYLRFFTRSGGALPQERLRIHSSGATTMHVNNEDHDTFRFTTQGVDEAKLIMKDASDNDDIVLNTGGNSWINASNFGIGINNPSTKLDVRPTAEDPTTGSPAAGSFSQIRADDATVGKGPSLALMNLSGSKETGWRLSALTASGNNGDFTIHGYGGGATYSERLRITAAGLIGISDTDPRTGLTINKYGTAPTTNANTYSYPAGRWVSTWNTETANNTDYWAGFGGGGYAVSSGSVNIALASNHNNTSQQAGMYIAGEATSLTSADFTIGKLVAGSAIGSSDVAGNQRATKSELMRVTGDGKVGINNTDPQTTLNVQGTISTGRNLAREVGTVISASTNFNSSRDADNVINGKKNYENGGNDWLTAGGSRNDANLVIDLGAQYAIDRVVIYNQNEYSTSHREVKRFNLEGSNDNSSWTLLIDDELGRSDAHEPNPGFSFRLPHVSSPGAMQDDNEGENYRYWRFTMKDFHDNDSYGGIMEIELYEASNAVDSEVSTHSVVASDVYTQTLSAQRLAIGENGALGDFRAIRNENVYINGAARFGQNSSDSSGNADRYTGWRMYGYNPAGVNSRYQWTQDGFHGRKSFYYYFPNGVANQAIRFHSNRNSFWTCGFITINAQYSNQNASGMLRYHFQHNANGATSYGKTIDVDVNIGNTSGNFGMSNSYSFKSWGSNGGSSTSHALELRHLTSTGNGVYITIELYGNHLHNHMDDLYMTTGHTY